MKFILASALFALAGIFFSCTKPGSDQPQTPTIDISMGTYEVPNTSIDSYVKVNCDGEWTLSIQYPQGTLSWAGFGSDKSQTLSGSGTSYFNLLKYSVNNSGSARSLTVIGTSKGAADTLVFAQRRNNLIETDIPDDVPGWMELPACDNSKLEYYNHDMTIGGKSYRNYSFYWDAANLVAHWVAYPMWTGVLSSGGRTDAWGTRDPKLSNARQPFIAGTFRGYDRGHQCPSHDRCKDGAANVATFYGTNITAQLGSLNQKGWVTLEGLVNSWTRSFDTLYVVTGCTVGSGRTVSDTEGKSVAVPSAYYKALLGFRKEGNNYWSIAFYYPHEAYSGGVEAKSLSVSALESKLKTSHGESVTFFKNLPSSKASVKNQTYSTWITLIK